MDADPVFAAAKAVAERKRMYDARQEASREEIQRVYRAVYDAARFATATGGEVFVSGWATALIGATQALELAGLDDLLAADSKEPMPHQLARAALRSARDGRHAAETAARSIVADEVHREGVRTALDSIADTARQRLRRRCEDELRREYPELAPPEPSPPPPEPNDDKKGVKEPEHAGPKLKASKIALALGVLADHPDWLDTEIARAAGCTPEYLSRNQKYQAAKAAIAESGKAQLRRSGPGRGNAMEEYSENDRDE